MPDSGERQSDGFGCFSGVVRGSGSFVFARMLSFFIDALASINQREAIVL